MCFVREGKWPHLTLTLAALGVQLHTNPAVLLEKTSRKS